MDLQTFLEDKAEKPVFAIAAVSMIARAAAYYSGQADKFRALLGPSGMEWYNTITGISLAAGCELLGSIAGRNWRRNSREAHEATARKGLNKAEREALVKYFRGKAYMDLAFMVVGVVSSFIAALSFLMESNPDHTPGAVTSEVVLTVLLLSVTSYLGIFKDSKREDATEAQAAKAQALSNRIIDSAGQRIAANAHTPQDVRLFARALPKQDRERFLAAFAAETADDPHWTTTDIVNWLDCNHPAGKRGITRKLARLEATGAPVMRNEKGQYIIPRSQVFLHFADDFLAMSRNSQSSPSVRTLRRSSGPLNAQESQRDSDGEPSMTGGRQAGASAGAVTPSVA